MTSLAPSISLEEQLECLDSIKKFIGYTPNSVIAAKLDAAIESLRRLKDDDWVSVKDRLPERDVFVLAHGISKKQSQEVLLGFVIHNYASAAKIDGDDCYFTHWKPLPTPPAAATGSGG